jgi:muconolactone delta-isomerase
VTSKVVDIGGRGAHDRTREPIPGGKGGRWAAGPAHSSKPPKEVIVEFLVDFEISIPEGTPESEVEDRENAEASAAAKLVDEGHLVRVWKRPVARGETKIIGLYRADSETQLDGLLGALPLYEWMHVTVTPLNPHPNDPGAALADTSQP